MSTSSIRLLQLESTGYSVTSSTRLKGSLIQVELEEAPSYEALSYTWGSRFASCEIKIDGLHVPITQNLWEFLSRIRHSSLRRTLWVDALCISQTDLDEKSQQVQMIGEIFRRAKTVLVWLGPHSDGSERLFGQLNPQASISTISSNLNAEEQAITGTWVKLLSRQYWNRTWIVQEVLLARSLLVFCGPGCLDWDTLTNRFLETRMEKQSAGYFHGYQEAVRRFRYLYKRKSELRESASTSTESTATSDIFNIILDSKGTECEDTRDKVYALLSLSSTPTSILPDYTISTAQLLVSLCAMDHDLNRDKFWQLVRTLDLYDVDSCYDIVRALMVGHSLNPLLSKPKVTLVLNQVGYRCIHVGGNATDQARLPILSSSGQKSENLRKALALEATFLLTQIEKLDWKVGSIVPISDALQGHLALEDELARFYRQHMRPLPVPN